MGGLGAPGAAVARGTILTLIGPPGHASGPHGAGAVDEHGPATSPDKQPDPRSRSANAPPRWRAGASAGLIERSADSLWTGPATTLYPASADRRGTVSDDLRPTRGIGRGADRRLALHATAARSTPGQAGAAGLRHAAHRAGHVPAHSHRDDRAPPDATQSTSRSTRRRQRRSVPRAPPAAGDRRRDDGGADVGGSGAGSSWRPRRWPPAPKRPARWPPLRRRRLPLRGAQSMAHPPTCRPRAAGRRSTHAGASVPGCRCPYYQLSLARARPCSSW